MIGRLTGNVLERRPDRVLLDVGGVGYAIQIPLSTFYALSEDGAATATLHIHTHVREDALQLFGFADREERAAFELLIGISGVGPRLALAILSGIGADELRGAVARQDRPRLQQIPGVGKKTAERVLLELRDKIDGARKRGSGAADPPASWQSEPSTGVRDDAVSALVNLGYSRDVARKAVESALEGMEEDVAIERLIREALGGLVR